MSGTPFLELFKGYQDVLQQISKKIIAPVLGNPYSSPTE
jgi:hypothetical protein